MAQVGLKTLKTVKDSDVEKGKEIVMKYLTNASNDVKSNLPSFANYTKESYEDFKKDYKVTLLHIH